MEVIPWIKIFNGDIICFIIVHRLSTIACQQVIVLKNGRIIEQKSHYEFLAKKDITTTLNQQ